MTHLVENPTLLGAMLALCGVAVLACAYATTRALWRFWQRRRWKPVTTPLHGTRHYHVAFYDDDGKPVYRRNTVNVVGTDCNLMDKVRAEHVSDTEYKGAAVPYASGGPVPGAPVTRAEFEHLRDRVLAMRDDFDQFAGDTNDRLDGPDMSVPHANPSMTAEYIRMFGDLRKSAGLRFEEAGPQGFATAYAQAQADFGAALDSLRATAEPDSGIRVFGGPAFYWLYTPDGEGWASWRGCVWDRQTKWNVSECFAAENPELHGDEKARVIADWRENRLK